MVKKIFQKNNFKDPAAAIPEVPKSKKKQVKEVIEELNNVAMQSEEESEEIKYEGDQDPEQIELIDVSFEILNLGNCLIGSFELQL